MGFGLAKLLLEHDAYVSIADVDQPALHKAAENLEAMSSSEKVIACLLDVRQPQQIAAWLDQTIERFGHIDSAANVAGVIDFPSTATLFEDQTNEGWDWVLGVNLNGLANCMRNELKTIELAIITPRSSV